MKEINQIPAFKRFCMTVGNLPSAFLESMTYYEALQWLLNYIDTTIIPSINAEGEAITELQNEFTILKTYVDNYFDNLDVQEEINTKLDEMAESGELTDIIAQYLNLAGVLAYNTLDDLKAAENIVNGSITRILGKNSYNDGYGAYYKIRNILNTDVIDNDNIIAITNNNNLVGEKIISVLDKKTNYITPEMFGAVGDGETDDSQAFIDMFDYIDSVVPEKVIENAETTTKDYEYVTILFSKLYGIAKEIEISSTTGLHLQNLKLIALGDFDGDSLLKFSTETRDLTLDNCILNGNLNVDYCIAIEDYSLVTRITNSWITRFKEIGVYANNDKGHEIIISNTKINQVEYDEYSTISTLVNNGIGLYLGTQRYDNHFTDVIINYCKDYNASINSGTNYFNQCHFYGGKVVNNGGYNYFNNSYFDFVVLNTKGFVFINGCTFTSSSNPFIEISDTYSNLWKYQNSYINNSVFKNSGESGDITDSLIFTDGSWSSHETEFSIEMLGNSFYDCPLLEYKVSYAYFPDPFKVNKYTGNADNGSVRIGDTLIQYGKINATDAQNWIYFPTAYQEYVMAVIIVPLDSNSTNNLFAGQISNERFWANRVAGDCKWIAIGRMYK